MSKLFIKSICIISITAILCCMCVCCSTSLANKKNKKETSKQVKDEPIEIIKSPKFQTMELPIEKSSAKKFTWLRRIYHNTTVRYNYVSNIQQELNEIVDSAKENFIEDYLQKPLPFYNYSADFITKAFANKLDSILFRLTAAVLLHDARNKWVDEVYLLMGQTYFYQQQYDSAFLMFEFLKYKFDKTIVNNFYIDDEGNKKNFNSTNIVNREKKHWYGSEPEARNDALIWLIKVYIAREEYDEALILMDALDKDIFFPKRLLPVYEEVKAYYYYHKKQYIPSAQHLITSIKLSKDRQERARKSYLVAQMYNLGEKEELATEFLRQCIQQTYDPVLEIYGRMNFILQEKHPNVYVINEHITQLLKLLKRERFKRYKDLIYYAASFMALKKNDMNEAIFYVKKSIEYAELEYGPDKEKIYTQLFLLTIQKKQYASAAKALDSLSDGYLTSQGLGNYIAMREPLHKLVTFLNNKQAEDSLQRVALLSQSQRDEYIKKKINKAYDELVTQIKIKKKLAVYYNQDNSIKDNWVFNDKARIENGINQFKAVWGNRKNTDNWRRRNDIKFDNSNEPEINIKQDSLSIETYNAFVESFLNNLPLTPEQREKSNEKIANYLYKLAEIYYLDLQDFETAQDKFEEVLARFPNSSVEQEVFLNLYFCYKLNDQPTKIEQIKNQYLKKYAQGKYVKLFSENNFMLLKNETKEYEFIFNLYKQQRWEELNRAYIQFVHRYPMSKLKTKAKLLLAMMKIIVNENQEANNLLHELDSEIQLLYNNNKQEYTAIATYVQSLLSILNSKPTLKTQP